MEIKPRSSMNGGDTPQNQQPQPAPPAPQADAPPQSVNESTSANEASVAPQQPAESPASPPQPAYPQQTQQQAQPSPATSATGASDNSPKPFAMDTPSPSGTNTSTSPSIQTPNPNATPPNATEQPSKPFNVEEAKTTPGVSSPTPVPPQPAPAPTNTTPSAQVAQVPAQPAGASSSSQPTPQGATSGATTPTGSATGAQQQPASAPSPAVASPAQAPAQPPQTPQTNPATASATPPPPLNKSGSRKLNLPLLVGIVTGLIVLLAGFVFGYYLPNRPENVYKTGLDRTGDVIHDLIVEATETEQIEELSRMQVTGSMDITAEDMEFEGSLTSRFDEQSSDSSFSIDFVDPNGSNPDIGLSGDVRTNIAEGERLPDVYFQLTGMQSLGLDAFLPGISRYDGRWIEISSAYLESTVGEYYDELEEDGDSTIETEDYAELARNVSATTNKYVFSSDEETAVFEMVEFIDREDVEGLSTNRYTATINTANLSAYCSELADVVIRSELNRKLSGLSSEDMDTAVEEAQEDCSEENIDIDDDYTFDLWIDRSTKLIHKVRFYDMEADHRNNYIEVGQRYDGGDELELFMNITSEDDDFDASSTVRTNLETNTSTSNFTFEQRGANAFDLTATLQVEPYNETIDVERPAGAISIERLMEELFGATVLGTQTELEQTNTLEATDVDEVLDELEAGQEESVDGEAPSEPVSSPLQDFYERYIRD